MNIQRVQRIPKFVRDAGGEQCQRRNFFRFQRRRRALPGFGDIPENHRHPGHRIVRLFHQRYDVKTQKPLPGIKHLQLARQNFAPFVFVSGKNFLPIQIAQMFGERIADCALWVETKHLGGGGIEITNFAIAPGHDDAFLNGVEKRFEKTFFPRKFQHKTLQALRVHPVNPTDEFVEKCIFHNRHQFIFDNAASRVPQCRKFHLFSRQNPGANS